MVNNISKIKKILCIVFVISFLLSSCGLNDNKDLSLNVGTTKITGCFNPFYAVEDGDIKVINQVFDSILRRKTNNTFQNEAGSISYQLLDDGKVKYTVSIRDDLFFFDGSRVTIDDVIFWYYFISDATYDGVYSDFYLNDIVGLKEYYFDDPSYEDRATEFEVIDFNRKIISEYISENYSDGIDVNTISGIKRIDDYTCTVLCNSMNINMVSQLNCYLVSKTFYSSDYTKGNADKVKSLTTDARGSGVYSIDSFDSAKGIAHLTVNSYHQIKPSFNRVNIISSDEKDLIKKIKSGKLDIISLESDNNSFGELNSENITCREIYSPEYVSLYINVYKHDDINFRKYVFSLVNVFDFVDKSLQNRYSRLYRPLSMRSEEYPQNASAYVFSVSDESKPKNQMNMNLYCCSDKDSFEKEVADYIADSLTQNGIITRVVVCTYDELVKAAQNGKADLWLVKNPDIFTCDKYEYYHSEGKNNLTGLSLPAIDTLTENIRTSTGESNRKNLVSALLDYVMSNANELPLYQRKYIVAFNTEKINNDSLSDVYLYDGNNLRLSSLY